ncbi:alpha/beta fold hydrolase [Geomonas sp. RF6]|uniref:alpha/beta fold hydrolase n=1 Tax=Geomonas sp. RF6 TaxID=2897342 RepID=UPI001E2DEAA4|nr:alpha/beta fold hydrolase [Geomonas sp. RF6]UFS70674.1 alpha/beta fold hydrolase [Geomonas sp. RF6]
MRLHFETYGEGEPLVILHGLFGSLENWRGVARALARDFQVFSLDLRNHGRSPHSDDHDCALMASDVRRFIAERSLRRVFLLGHSMGGKVAMHLAVTSPETVGKLVVVDISPKQYAPRHREILHALTALRPELYRERKEIDHALSTCIPDCATRLFLLKNLVLREAGGFSWRINLGAIARGYRKIIHAVPPEGVLTSPALFLKGASSDYIDEADLPIISRPFPAARLVTVPDSGHWVHADNPEFFLNTVISFLQS